MRKLSQYLLGSLLSLMALNIWAEGDAITQPYRPSIPSLPNQLNPNAIRTVTQLRTLGSIQCPAHDTHNGRTVCSNSAVLSFNSESAELDYALQVQAPANHCAPIVYTALLDNQQQVQYSSSLNAGENAYIDLGNGLTRGMHRLRIGAIAQVGQGCNQTGLQSWSVKANVVIKPQ